MAMNRFSQLAKGKLSQWLGEGMSPARLAITLALGFSIGCLPITGIPTVICLLLAFSLRLNIPVIQAANFIAWPVQLILIFPMVRFGHWILMHLLGHELNLAQGPEHPVLAILSVVGGFTTNMTLGWLVALGPSILIMNLVFRVLLRRVPVAA